MDFRKPQRKFFFYLLSLFFCFTTEKKTTNPSEHLSKSHTLKKPNKSFMKSSDSQNLTSCLVIFFLFPLLYHFPCASSQQELGSCQAQFLCGNITAGFPFWGGNRPEHCGLPLLELHCNKNNSTSLFISNQEYYVLNVDQTSYTLTLARSDLVGPFCSAKFNTTILPVDYFEILPTYKNLTVFYHCPPSYSYISNYTCPGKGIVLVTQRSEYQCNETFIVNVPQSFFPNETEFALNQFQDVLRKGFEVKVIIDEISCQECSSSGGICGFNSTTQVCCKKTSPLGGVSCVPKRQPTAEELHSLCSTQFICGDQTNLLYPFWIPGREQCGHPDFKLNCIGGFAEVTISSVKVRILEANYNSRFIRLASSNYISNICPQELVDAPFDQNVLQFAPNTELLTIYYGCRDFSFSTPVYDPTYFKEFRCDGGKWLRNYYVMINISSPLLNGVRDLLNVLKKLCSNVRIPVSLNTLQRTGNLKQAVAEGFEVGLNRECSMCMESGGGCGYNQTSRRFLCYCNSGPYHATCGSGKSNNGTKRTILIGSLAGGLVLLFIITLLFLIKRKTSHEYRQQNLKTLIPLKHYSYSQVKKITKSFAEVIGKGGFGTVYRGTLFDGRTVAVKVLKDSKGNGEDFINEVASMSKTSHVNIVSLLGFCSEGSKRAIISEYLINGSLDQFISNKTSMNMDQMTLYGIALGVARGLEYLHYGCKTRIVHFDIKPQNVLLDENLCPRVSDFGLAKLCEKKESSMSLLDTRGTIGYIAPEMISRVYGSVSHESDVYSYRMLLLEMIGARDQTSTENSELNASSMYFPEWIYKDLEKGENQRLVGHRITNQDGEMAKKMTLVGLWCIQFSPLDRPPMNKVVLMMEGSLDALEVPPRPVLQQIPKSSWISEGSSSASEIYSKN